MRNLLVSSFLALLGSNCGQELEVPLAPDIPSAQEPRSVNRSMLTRLSVKLTAPDAGAVVRGKVDLRAAGTGAARVEFLIDGVPAATSRAEPYLFVWDTATAHKNPLPAPNHAMDLGYYFVDGRYGDYRSEVRDYTNLYYAWAWRNYPTDMPWGPPFSDSMRNAAAEGRRVHLNLQEPGYYNEALNRAAPYWSAVQRLELADEPPWTRAETEAQLAAVRRKLTARGLSGKPLGIVYTRDQILHEDAIFARGLDWVGIEAYVDAPGSPDPQDNIDALTDWINEAKARVPADKKLVLVMMAYDRNGNWRDMATLAALQEPVYQLSHDDPRVLAITLFSYGRPGGTHDHPELKPPHQRIGERVLGKTVAALSNGPHAITVRAYGSSTDVASDSIIVTVAN